MIYLQSYLNDTIKELNLKKFSYNTLEESVMSKTTKKEKKELKT
jgi:hypothetical protein